MQVALPRREKGRDKDPTSSGARHTFNMGRLPGPGKLNSLLGSVTKARALTKAVVVPSCLGASKTTSLVQEIICNTQNLLSPVFNDSWTLARKSKKECIVHEL